MGWTEERRSGREKGSKRDEWKERIDGKNEGKRGE